MIPRPSFSTLLTWALCLAVANVSAGCFNLRKQAPVKKRYVLDVQRPTGKAAANSDAPILQVRRFSVSPRYEGKGFVYRTGANSYVVDFYNEYFSSPTLNLMQVTSDWLRRSGLFRSVVPTSSSLKPTHILEADVLALYGDFRDKGSPRAVVALNVILVEAAKQRSNGAKPNVLWQRTFRAEVSVADKSADTLVGGLQKALRESLNQLEAALRESL